MNKLNKIKLAYKCNWVTEAHRLKSVDIPKYVQETYVLPSGSITVSCFCDSELQ